MRKVIVLSFISLDGVMQAPGGPEEDTSGGFKYGGWSALYGDEVGGKIVQKQMQPADLDWDHRCKVYRKKNLEVALQQLLLLLHYLFHLIPEQHCQHQSKF